MDDVAFVALAPRFAASGDIPPKIIIGFAFMALMAAIAGISVRVASGREQAKQDAEALRRQLDVQAQTTERERADQDARRQAAIAEALRREPDLGASDDASTLRRLAVITAQIEAELQLKADVERLRAAEAEASARKMYELGALRTAQEAEARAAQLTETRRIDKERRAAERQRQLDAMPPTRRAIAEHRSVLTALAIAIVLLLAFVAWSLIQVAGYQAQQARDQQAEEASIQLDAAKASCDPARASSETRVEVLSAWAACPRADVRLRVAGNPATSPLTLAKLAGGDNRSVQLAILQRETVPPEAMAALAQSPDLSIQRLVVQREDVTSEALTILAKSPDLSMQRAVLERQNLPAGVLAALANSSDLSIQRAILRDRDAPREALYVLASSSDLSIRRQLLTHPKADRTLLIILSNDADMETRLEAERLLD